MQNPEPIPLEMAEQIRKAFPFGKVQYCSDGTDSIMRIEMSAVLKRADCERLCRLLDAGRYAIPS